jgi:hypothetical protein
MLVSASAASTWTLRARSSGIEMVMFFTVQRCGNTEFVSRADFSLHRIFPGDALGAEVHHDDKHEAVDKHAEISGFGIGKVEEGLTSPSIEIPG